MGLKYPAYSIFLGFIVSLVHGADLPYRISGQGWAEFGRIGHSTDTLEVNLNRNSMQSAGAQFTAFANIGENWEGAFGFGGYQIHSAQGNDVTARYTKFSFSNFITEARMTYFRGERERPDFSLTFGNFDYNYNPDVKNLGLYLLRGPVYPGFLVSGFMQPAMDGSKGDILGLKLHHAYGRFSQDLIFSNERELPPSFDWHLAYVAKFKPSTAFEIGAGVNFYRLLSANKDLTTPARSSYAFEGDLIGQADYHPYDGRFIEIDTSGSAGDPSKWDTTAFTHRGTKLMGMMVFDPKAVFDLGGALGGEDLKFYAETALLGVRNYGTVYGNPLERMPVVAGFNLPAFGLLDVASIEVEWYGARYRNDISKLTNGNDSELPSPLPMSYKQYDGITGKGGVDAQGRLVNDTTILIRNTELDIQNLTSDDIKWSLFLQKTVRNHIRFMAQLANDHYRPGKVRTSCCKEDGGTAEAASSLRDWYFMFRLGYFF